MTGTSQRGLPMRTALVLAGGGVNGAAAAKAGLGHGVAPRRGWICGRPAVDRPGCCPGTFAGRASSVSVVVPRRHAAPSPGSAEAAPTGRARFGARPRRLGGRPRCEASGGWPCRWPSPAPGVLFATSAGAARGGDLRGGNRTDLGDLIRVQEQQVAALDPPGRAAAHRGGRRHQDRGAPPTSGSAPSSAARDGLDRRGRAAAGAGPGAAGDAGRRAALRRPAAAGGRQPGRPRRAPAGRAGRRQRAVGGRRRGGADHGPAGHRRPAPCAASATR